MVPLFQKLTLNEPAITKKKSKIILHNYIIGTVRYIGNAPHLSEDLIFRFSSVHVH